MIWKLFADGEKEMDKLPLNKWFGAYFLPREQSIYATTLTPNMVRFNGSEYTNDLLTAAKASGWIMLSNLRLISITKAFLQKNRPTDTSGKHAGDQSSPLKSTRNSMKMNHRSGERFRRKTGNRSGSVCPD